MRITTKLFIFILSLVTVACSSSDGYNADTAKSPYEPSPTLRKVASVKTTNTIDGREYSWEHKFTYDAQGRIKDINTVMHHHRAVTFADVVRYYKCVITSRANYYYKGERLEVDYTVTREYPDYPDWNTRESETDKGLFNKSGVLSTISSIDFVYSTTQLLKAYSDGGREYTVMRDASGDVTGYLVKDVESDSLILNKADEYRYSRLRNKTNFDFSAYFGYWGVEQEMYANRTPYYASYQLGAFGMLGATSPYLPLSIKNSDAEGGDPYIPGSWELDSQDCPVSFTDATGRKTVVTYVE